MTYNRKVPHLLKSDPDWPKRRKRILDQEPWCRACAELGYQTPATTVDHIVPRARGGSHLDINLQPLCGSCHDAKTAREKHGGLDDRVTVNVDGTTNRTTTVVIRARQFGNSARAKFLSGRK